MNTVKKFVQEAIEETKVDINNFLPDVNTTPNSTLKSIIRSYCGVFHPYYIAWMTATEKVIQSEYAKFVTAESIICQTSDMHQEVIRFFAEPIDCFLPTRVDVDRYQKGVNNVWELLASAVKKKHGAYGLTVMAVLKNTSLIFIPWLSKAAKHLSNKDEFYDDVYGKLDIEFADEFIDALIAESNVVAYVNSSGRFEKHVYQAKLNTTMLLQIIFEDN